MEYFIGAITTLAITIILNRTIHKRVLKKSIPAIRFSQSSTFEMTKHMIPIQDLIPSFGKRKPTQTTKHFNQTSVRILFLDNKAWWIKDNVLYSSDIVDGSFDKDSAERVDTIAMDKIQLDKTIFIVEKLTEGLNNDSGYPGKS